MVVEDLPSAGPVPNSLPERIAQLDAEGAFRDGDDIVGLYLYRESDGSTRQLFDRLVSERHVRLFRKDLLVSLAEEVLAGRTRHEEALAILTAGYRSGDPGA